MFKTAYEWGGHIDLFIANAGIEEIENFYALPGSGSSCIREKGEEEEEPVRPSTKVIDVNLFSVLYGLRLFRHYNRLSKKEGGECARMFVTTIMAGFYEFPALPIYSATKHAVRLFPLRPDYLKSSLSRKTTQLVGLVRASSIKLCRDESILINAVGPGPVDTPIAAMLKNFVPAEQFTPMNLMVKALDKIVDEDFTGQVIECTNKNLNLVKFAEFSCANSRELIESMTRH